MNYTIRDITLTSNALETVADFILQLDWDQPEFSGMHSLPQRRFGEFTRAARRLKDALEGATESTRRVSQRICGEIKRLAKKCILAMTRIITGHYDVRGIEDCLRQLAASPTTRS